LGNVKNPGISLVFQFFQCFSRSISSKKCKKVELHRRSNTVWLDKNGVSPDSTGVHRWIPSLPVEMKHGAYIWWTDAKDHTGQLQNIWGYKYIYIYVLWGYYGDIWGHKMEINATISIIYWMNESQQPRVVTEFDLNDGNRTVQASEWLPWGKLGKRLHRGGKSMISLTN
jgi:hypothetical protein